MRSLITIYLQNKICEKWCKTPFQNGPKKLNKTRKESEGDVDIHKKKVQMSKFSQKKGAYIPTFHENVPVL